MKTIKFDFNGTQITITLNESGKVHTCSHWDLIDEIANAGILSREGTKANYHHREYYYRFQNSQSFPVVSMQEEKPKVVYAMILGRMMRCTITEMFDAPRKQPTD